MNWWGESSPDPSWFYGSADYDPWLTSIGVEKNPEASLPDHFSLSQNYPNPFNPVTQIRYALPKDCWVRLEFYNILGQKVATLIDGEQKAGYKKVSWDGGCLSSGVLFYRIQAEDYVKTMKMIFLR